MMDAETPARIGREEECVHLLLVIGIAVQLRFVVV
jgi:hypothetical protein